MVNSLGVIPAWLSRCSPQHQVLAVAEADVAWMGLWDESAEELTAGLSGQTENLRFLQADPRKTVNGKHIVG